MTSEFDAAALVEAHRAAGRLFLAGGVRSFVREEGDGPPVVLLHGVPMSSFLYRKLMSPLAEAGLRAIAFDYPGLGLAERPREFDYSASGLSRFVGQAVDALELDRFHLVVHDIGGVVGCEWAAREPDRVLSLTVMNAAFQLSEYRDPWMFWWTRVPVVRRVALATTNRGFFAWVMYRHGGISNREAVSRAEVDAHFELLTREDGGRAFLEINNGWVVPEKERPLREALRERPYPAQVIWGEDDPVLGGAAREYLESVLGVESTLVLRAGHFLQEEQAPAIAQAIIDFVRANAA